MPFLTVRLLVIFMFLLCSGGGWWYRCWLRNRFPDTQTSVTRTSTNNSMTQSRRPAMLTRSRPSSMAVPPVDNLNPSGGQFQVARVSYSSSGDRLILHRLWKGKKYFFGRNTIDFLNWQKNLNRNSLQLSNLEIIKNKTVLPVRSKDRSFSILITVFGSHKLIIARNFSPRFVAIFVNY